MDNSIIAECTDYIAVRRLQNRYVDIATRRAFSELDQVFLPTTTLSLSVDGSVCTGPAEIGALLGTHLNPLSFNAYAILNTVIGIGSEGNLDAAKSRSHIWEIHVDEHGRRSDYFGVYHDRYERIDGRWWFADRRVNRLGDTGPSLRGFPFPDQFSDFI